MWQTEQHQKCSACGTFDWEWEDDPDAWQAGIHWCLGCRSIEILSAESARDAKHTEGYKLRLYKTKREED